MSSSGWLQLVASGSNDQMYFRENPSQRRRVQEFTSVTMDELIVCVILSHDKVICGIH